MPCDFVTTECQCFSVRVERPAIVGDDRRGKDGIEVVPEVLVSVITNPGFVGVVD